MMKHNRGANILSRMPFTFIAVSLLLMILNLLFIYWGNIPWLDEVMITDTAVNFHLDGLWRTTAWYDGGQQSPFSTYPPLYQMLMVVWLKLFGFTQFVCKSLNIFLTFVLSVVLMNFMYKQLKIRAWFALFTFLGLFWLSGVFAEIYRFGRVDILNILTATIFLKYTYNFINTQKHKGWLLISSVFVLLSGVQACIFVVLVLFWAYVFYPKYRNKVFYSALYFAYGSLVAMLMLLVFFYYNDHLFAFLVSLVSYSSSLKRIAVLALPLIGPLFHLDVDAILLKVAPDADAPSFLGAIVDNYTINPDYLFLLFLGVFIAAYLFFFKRSNGKSYLVILGFSFFVPLFMSLAGRYVLYYTWMAYLPVLMGFIGLVDLLPKKWFSASIFMLALGWIMVSGFPKTLIQSERIRYDQVHTFIKKQNFDGEATVIAPFSVYYQLRKETSKGYFIGIYPQEYLPKGPLYVIKDTVDYENAISNYLELRKSEGVNVVAIDSLDELGLMLYKVE